MPSKKIGLALFYSNENYGSALQAYAIQRVLAEKGLEYEIVNYRKDKSLKTIGSYLPQLFIGFVLKRKIRLLLRSFLASFLKNDIADGVAKRHDAFVRFRNQYFVVSKPVLGWKNLQKRAIDYSMVIVGNDQVWAPICLGQHFFTLEWVPNSIKKVAYGSSFGVSEIPKIQLKATKKYLNRIDSISVRENAGQQIVQDLIGQNVPVVLDATMLYNAQEWESIAGLAPIVSGKYIFCYFLGENENHRKFARQLQIKVGMKIVCIPHLNGFTKSDVNFGDVTLYDIDPGQFINLIKFSEFVCTDSYHATIFSILHNRQFFNFKRYKSEKGSINSRLETLLTALNLMFYQVDESISLEDALALKSIDYKTVFEKLEKLKKESFEFLDNVLLQGTENER